MKMNKNVIMIIAGAVILFLIYWFFLRKKKSESSYDDDLLNSEENGYKRGVTILPNGKILPKCITKREGNTITYTNTPCWENKWPFIIGLGGGYIDISSI